jgi:hypothetical protein
LSRQQDRFILNLFLVFFPWDEKPLACSKKGVMCSDICFQKSSAGVLWRVIMTPTKRFLQLAGNQCRGLDWGQRMVRGGCFQGYLERKD